LISDKKDSTIIQAPSYEREKMADSNLVYSTKNNSQQSKKEKNKNNSKNLNTANQGSVNPQNTTLKLKLERKGRKGKSVTIIFELPSNQEFCLDLTKQLKSKLGVGGAFKNNQIEIQGDQRETIRSLLEKLGFKVKQSGS